MKTSNTLWGEFITFNVNKSDRIQTLSIVIFKTQYVANPVAVQTAVSSVFCVVLAMNLLKCLKCMAIFQHKLPKLQEEVLQ
jgi:hypothetical protein